MTDKLKKPPTIAELEVRSLSRWENEGGATASGADRLGKPSKRPRDPNQLAKLMIDIATGDEREPEKTASAKGASAAGAKGGPAREATLSLRSVQI